MRYVVKRLHNRNKRYWLTAIAVLLLATWTRPFVEQRLALSDLKNAVFATLTSSVTNPTTSGRVKLCLIGDDEYWTGPLHHRVPTDRSYLARLIKALDVADASVIALDFDLRLPTPTASFTVGEYVSVDTYEPYRQETDTLIRAIDDVASRRKVVLTKTMVGPVDGPFTFLTDIYQLYGICTKLTALGKWENPGTPAFPLSEDAKENISCGYIALMSDKRRIPPPVRITGEKGLLDSFSLALVRAREQEATPSVDGAPYYASYIPRAETYSSRTTVSAHDLLNHSEKARVLSGWPTIVGAAWSQRSQGGGDTVDLHDTPIGKLGGVIIHDNLAEALLGNRVFRGLSDQEVFYLDLCLGMSSACFFALFSAWWARAIALLLFITILFLLQWLVLQLFGTFLDAFVPVLGLGIHAIFDRLVGEIGGSTNEV